MSEFHLPLRQKPALAVVLSACLAVLVLGVVAQYLPAGRDRVHDEIEPVVAALLPAGASVTATVTLPDAPQTARAVAYSLGRMQYFALIAWNREAEGYRVTSTATYEAADDSPVETASLGTESFGPGAPVAFIARGSLGASTELVTVFARVGDELVPVMLTDEDGRTAQAQFSVGASAAHVDHVRFEDIDGDGDKDAIHASLDMPDGVAKDETRTVYAWRDGMFVHDMELSRVLSLRGALFPEPDAPPEVSEETTRE